MTSSFDYNLAQQFSQSMADQGDSVHLTYDDAKPASFETYRTMLETAMDAYGSAPYKTEGFYTSFQELKELGRLAVDISIQEGAHDKRQLFAMTLNRVCFHTAGCEGAHVSSLRSLEADFRGYAAAQEKKAAHRLREQKAALDNTP